MGRAAGRCGMGLCGAKVGRGCGGPALKAGAAGTVEAGFASSAQRSRREPLGVSQVARERAVSVCGGRCNNVSSLGTLPLLTSH